MTIKDKFTVKPIQRYETHDWFLNKHYAKRVPSITYCFGLYDTNKVLKVKNLICVPFRYTSIITLKIYI